MNAKSDTTTLDALSKRAALHERYKFFSVLFGLGILCTIFAVLVLWPFKYEAHQDARAVFRGNDLFKDLQARTEAEMAELGRQIEQSKVDLNVFDFPLSLEDDDQTNEARHAGTSHSQNAWS